ncbi:MAG: hypothetical protein MK080_12610 [Opitutales bacterium]|nr:hypothetical protein [Opitutales bacterium]NRA28220.1 hypothetical protein [Opitutales bacterium]
MAKKTSDTARHSLRALSDGDSHYLAWALARPEAIALAVTLQNLTIAHTSLANNPAMF